MSIIVGCRCGKRFQAQPHLAGKRVKCPACGSPIVIPEAQADSQQIPTLEPLGASDAGDFWNQPVAPTPASPFGGGAMPSSPTFGVSSQPKRQIKIWPFVVAGVVASVVLLACGGGFFIWSRISNLVGQQREWISTLPDEDYADARRSFQTDLVEHGAPPRPPSFTPPRPPSFSRSRAVVVFEILGYEGRLPQRTAARHALIRISWVDISRIEVDESAGTLTVGVRGTSVSTVAAKSALEQAGFKIGSTTYHSAGLPP